MMKLDEKYKNNEFIEVMKKADLVIDQIIFEDMVLLLERH